MDDLFERHVGFFLLLRRLGNSTLRLRSRITRPTIGLDGASALDMQHCFKKGDWVPQRYVFPENSLTFRCLKGRGANKLAEAICVKSGAALPPCLSCTEKQGKTQQKKTTVGLQPHPPLAGVSWTLRARNPARVSKESPGACFETPETVSRLFRTLFGPRGRKTLLRLFRDSGPGGPGRLL